MQKNALRYLLQIAPVALGIATLTSTALASPPLAARDVDAVQTLMDAMGTDDPMEAGRLLAASLDGGDSNTDAASDLGARTLRIPRCLAATQTGLTTSALAFTGCPSDASLAALSWAWLAEAFSDGCALGIADCDDASFSAAYSAAWWQVTFEACTLGEPAAAVELTAWYACGAYEPASTPAPTPEETATPDATPTPEESPTPETSPTPLAPPSVTSGATARGYGGQPFGAHNMR